MRSNTGHQTQRPATTIARSALTDPGPTYPTRNDAGKERSVHSVRFSAACYLGYTSIAGAQLKYFVYSGERLLALMGFGASAWKIAPRDWYIGWSDEKREENLKLVVNNVRFLILAWINSKNLASMLLSRVAARLPEDWMNRYRYRPVLLETFVEKKRFTAASYRAAN